MSLHTEIVSFINEFSIQKYLEIGLGDQVNFNNIQVPYKVGISPDASTVFSDNYRIYGNTSDDGFKLIQDQKFDLIFIDGLHEYTQVVRDLHNSLDLLLNDGIIIIHDVNCINDKPDVCFDKIRELNIQSGWCGDVWKIVFHINQFFNLVDYVTIYDQDWVGFTVIWKRQPFIQFLREPNPYPCDNLTRHYAMCNSSVFNFTTLKSAIATIKFNKGL